MTLLHRQPIRRIAVLRALYLGDLLLAVPALRALRAGFPEAEITLISLPWAQSFAQRFGRYVDRFVAFEGYPGLQEVSVDPERSRRFVEEQRGHDYDLVIQMHGSGGQSNPCALALGGRMTAGFYLGEAPPGLDIAGPYPEHLPEVLRNIELVRMLGCPDRGAHLEFPVFPGDREAAEELLRPEWLIGAPLVGIHGGAKTQRQRWPAACFARVADTLVTRTGARIVLTGGPGEGGVAQEIAAHMETPAASVAGLASLGVLAGLIDMMDLLIGNDTGPVHLAEAVGTPTVRIFGPTDMARWAPLDEMRHVAVRHPGQDGPCSHVNAPETHQCWLWPDPEMVLEPAGALLESSAVAGRVS